LWQSRKRILPPNQSARLHPSATDLIRASRNAAAARSRPRLISRWMPLRLRCGSSATTPTARRIGLEQPPHTSRRIRNPADVDLVALLAFDLVLHSGVSIAEMSTPGLFSCSMREARFTAPPRCVVHAIFAAEITHRAVWCESRCGSAGFSIPASRHTSAVHPCVPASQEPSYAGKSVFLNAATLRIAEEHEDRVLYLSIVAPYCCAIISVRID
jgi:hypothetical protein